MAFSSVKEQPEARLIGREAAATYLDMTTRSLDRLVGKGLLRPIKIPGLRRVMFDRADLDALIDAGKARALGETPEEGGLA
jgi:hypothetical protein